MNKFSKPLLDQAQVDEFRREGYLIYNQPVLAPERFQALKAYFESILADLPASERPEAMDVPHFIHPKLPSRSSARISLFFLDPFHLQAKGQRIPFL